MEELERNKQTYSEKLQVKNSRYRSCRIENKFAPFEPLSLDGEQMDELQAVRLKKQEILAVTRGHGLLNVRIFGSVARGDDTPQSDIDFIVDLEKGRTLLDIGGALVKLQELLDRKVDIVTERGLHWYLRDKILKEARPL